MIYLLANLMTSGLGYSEIETVQDFIWHDVLVGTTNLVNDPDKVYVLAAGPSFDGQASD